MLNPLINLMKEPTSRWVTIASMMRSLAGISVATFLPIYFLKVFPDFKNQFAVLNAASLAIGGLISSLAGGIISDMFEKKNLMAKSYVCIVSSAVAFPLTALCCLITNNFWFSMIMITFKTLLSASFTSPAITMMQNTTNSKEAGGMISAHMFYTTIAATLSPMIVNYISIFCGAA